MKGNEEERNSRNDFSAHRAPNGDSQILFRPILAQSGGNHPVHEKILQLKIVVHEGKKLGHMSYFHEAMITRKHKIAIKTSEIINF
jgi:hypothetical protein